METALAVGVALGLYARWALLALVPLFAVIWTVGQGLRLPFTPGTTDLNSGPVYVLLALSLWRARSWDRWSVDAWAARGGPRSRPAAVRALGAGLGVVVLAALAAGSALAQVGHGGAPSPGPRAGAALALDPRSGQDILFGGCSAFACTRDTWAWSAQGWRRLRPRTAPPALGYAGIATGPSGRGLVLFGGAGALGAGPSQGATWLWNGRDWHRARTAVAPSPRRFAAMAADPAIGEVVLLGGDDGHGHVLAGTWLWDGRSWRRYRGPEPPARTGAAIAYDPQLRGVLLFGGNDGQRRLDDTWLFAGGGWVRIRARRHPPPRAYVQMAADPVAATVVLLTGSVAGGGAAATWTFSRGSWVPQPRGPQPGAATLAAVATAPAGLGAVCFGGATPSGYTFGATRGGYADRLWLWRGGRWTRGGGASGRRRRGHV